MSNECRRVLHVNRLFRPDFTGEGIFIEKLSPVMDLLDNNVRHDLLALDTQGDNDNYYHCSSVERVFYLGMKGRSFLYSYFIVGLFILGKIFKYDVLHFHSHIDRYFIISLIYKLFGRKVFYTATLTDSAEGLLNDHSPRARSVIARALKLIDKYICISRRLYNETLPYLGDAKTVHIPIGIYIPEISPVDRAVGRKALGLNPDLPALIFVGGVCRRKGPRLLVEALAELKRLGKSASLILVGPVLEDDYADEMRAIIDRHDLYDLVAWVGSVDNPDRYFALADVMTFPSHSEGFGTAVIEAMAMGLPVIARRLPGVNEDFVLQGKTGFLFDMDSDFLPLLLDLLEQPARQRELGEAARAHASQFYDMETVAERYLNLYRPERIGVSDWVSQHWAQDESCERKRLVAAGSRTSVLDHRTWVPWHAPSLDRPIILTTVDAEEEFDWGKPFARENRSTTNMAHQGAAEAIFAKYGIKPTYFITHPIVDDPNACALLKKWMVEERCEVGVQLHPWVTPPCVESVSIYNSYLGNLDTRLQYYKISELTNAIEKNLGVRPIAFRAGRYGIGHRTADILRMLGFQIDLSVVPNFDYSRAGGASFWNTPDVPYWCDREKSILEVPLTCGLAGAMPIGPQLASMLYGHVAELIHLPGILSRTGVVERIRLTPEGTDIDACQRLLRACVQQGKKVFVLSYHTPSLVRGNTPYARSQADVDQIIAWLDSFFSYFLNQMGGVAMSVSDFNAFARKN